MIFLEIISINANKYFINLIKVISNIEVNSLVILVKL